MKIVKKRQVFTHRFIESICMQAGRRSSDGHYRFHACYFSEFYLMLQVATIAASLPTLSIILSSSTYA